MGLPLIPFGLSIVQFQKVSLDFTFRGVVSSQSNICSNEVHVDWTCLQPDRAPQQRGLTQTQRLSGTLSRWLQSGGLGVLLLLNVLPDVYIVHHGTDSLSHCLVVKVAVSYTNDARLCREKRGGGFTYLTHCFKLSSLPFINVWWLPTLMLAAQPCSTTKRSTPSTASLVMVYFNSSDVRQCPGRQLIWNTNMI